VQLDSYTDPGAQELLRAGQARHDRRIRRRELITHSVAAAGFLTAAALLAVLAPWQRPLSAPVLALCLVAYVVAESVRFPVGGGFTVPTQVVFVPMLFVLPTPLVPLVVSAGVVLARLPEHVRGRTTVSRTVFSPGDNWYALGAAAVLVLCHAEVFAWARWPVFLLVFCGQVAFDLLGAVIRMWLAEGLRPGTHLRNLGWLYLVDGALSTVGLALAATAAARPGLVVLGLPVLGVLALFAQERRVRLSQVVALSDAYRGTALLLGDMVEADDAYTGSHSRGVLSLSLSVARRLGLDAEQQRKVEFGALLHDVGKIRVPKEIINKPGPLSPEEWSVMHRHTIEGERMLRTVGGVLADAGSVVRASHEHFDGTGYPDGLAGEAIPIEARIITACDAYSAMTTDRSYRRARPPQAALAELNRCSGHQFDPAVVEALTAAVLADQPEAGTPALGDAVGHAA
jgi:putative nucleotidyltransferase with HDIG domain